MTVPELWTESRCHVCRSDYRRAIDKMIAMGIGHTEISRNFGGLIDRRSIANHAIKHLNYQEAAIRRIIEAETEKVQEDAEQGLTGVTKRKVYLEAVLHKAMEQLLSDKTYIEPKDALNVISELNKFDLRTESLQLELIQDQLNAFIQAIREIAAQRVDPNLGNDILLRAREIMGVEAKTLPQLNPGS